MVPHVLQTERLTLSSMLCGLCVAMWGLALPGDSLAEPNWPQFRGAGARGTANDSKIPDRWSATENVAWKRDIPGRGWSSPVVWGNHLFLTTVENTGESEAPKKGLYFGGDRPLPPGSIHQWKVLCLDLVTGDVRWNARFTRESPKARSIFKSSYASKSPSPMGNGLLLFWERRDLLLRLRG